MDEIQIRKKGLSVLIVLCLVLTAIGCARRSVYQNWDYQIKQMLQAGTEGRFYTKEDVSIVVGPSPDRCETNGSSLKIGMFWEKPTLTLKVVLPNSPADEAGLRQGDVILSINSIGVKSEKELYDVLRRYVRDGELLIIGTNRGPFSLVPRTLIQEQCYWEIRAGSVAQSGAGGGWTHYGGGFSAGGGKVAV